MRKDVKRSLLLWPAAASFTITAVSWLPTQLPVKKDHVSPPQFLAALVPSNHVELLDSKANTSFAPVEATARAEYGARAMPLPGRVAKAFDVTEPNLKAPIRDERKELAGLLLGTRFTNRVARTKPNGKIQKGDLTEDVNRFQANRILPAGRSIFGGPITGPQEHPNASLRTTSRARVAESAPRVAESAARVAESAPPRIKRGLPRTSTLGAPSGVRKLVGPSVPAFWPSDLTIIDEPQARPASVIPRSIRALGRMQPDSPAIQDDSRHLARPDALKDAAKSLKTEQVPELELDRLSKSPAAPKRVFPIHQDRKEPVVNSSKPVESIRLPASGNPASWPATASLDEQLKLLAELSSGSTLGTGSQLVSSSTRSRISYERSGPWTEEVAGLLVQLRELPRLGDHRAGDLINKLAALGAEGSRQAESIEDRGHQIHWLRTAYAITRRTTIWRLVWEVSRGENAWMVGDQPKDSPTSISIATAEVRSDLEETGDAKGWNEYLLLDPLNRAKLDYDASARVVLAQRFLSRLQWHRLSSEQKRWLERESIESLSEIVRPWAQDAVDYANLMHQIELQEANPLGISSVDIAGAVQTLRFSDNPLAKQIAAAIDTHYRNANLRLALSSNMLQRALPDMEARSVPVDTRVLGSRVRGKSRIDSDLEITLVPSPDRWTLRLNTKGKATTNSTGVRGSVAVRTTGQSQFEAEKPIEITPAGVRLQGTQVDVRGATRLRSIDTQYDGWPLVGSLVRSIAENRYEAMAPQANRIAKRTMRSRIEAEVDQQVEQQVDAATERLGQLLLGPLGRMQLDPMVTDMQTTQQRLLARFRVAGDWQMAANTPRPRAPGSSLMSVQVHQSAINNTLEQVVPKGERMSIRDFVHRASEMFGRSDLEIPDDVPEDVSIQFSTIRPVTVEMEDDRLWITLRIVRLRRKDSLDLTQFVVRAAYRPQSDGMRASLVRDGHLRISGPRLSMRERLPARTIFNKVFSSNREIPVTLPKLLEHPAVDGLAISQLELRSGWIAIAISEEDAPRIALAP